MIGTVQARWRLKYLGRMIEDCVVLTDVWVKDGSQWQAIRRHSTPAPPGTCVDLKGSLGWPDEGSALAGDRSRN